MLSKACEESKKKGNTIKQQLYDIAHTFIKCNILGAQEAVYHILQIPLSKFSRATYFVNTRAINERTRMLENKKDLYCLDEDSKDIYKQSIFEYYAKRLEALENACLAEFVTNYTDDAIYNKSKKNVKVESDSDDENDSSTETVFDKKGLPIRKFRKLLILTIKGQILITAIEHNFCYSCRGEMNKTK